VKLTLKYCLKRFLDSASKERLSAAQGTAEMNENPYEAPQEGAAERPLRDDAKRRGIGKWAYVVLASLSVVALLLWLMWRIWMFLESVSAHNPRG
jgi:hypothetical protein